MKQLTLSHPIIDDNPTTFVSTDYSSGTTLTVKNTAGFAINDYIVLGRLGIEQTEIVQIQAIPTSTTFTLTGAAIFPHASDTVVTKIPYNQFKIYKSLTGVGGTYSILVTLPLQVDQQQNQYFDTTSASPYSYKMSYFNSTSSLESSFSDEIPFAGFPYWSLKTMQDSVLADFGDLEERFITRDDITRWINEFYQEVQLRVMGAESPYFLDNVILTMTGAESFDISTYSMIGIFMVEMSMDGGVNFNMNVSPKDFRQKDNPGSVSFYEYKIEAENIVFSPIPPKGYQVRIWYTTNPSTLDTPGNLLMNPFQGISGLFVKYAVMRAHEKDRKMTELADHFLSQINKALDSKDGIIYKLRRRIKQGNLAMADTWADDRDTW